MNIYAMNPITGNMMKFDSYKEYLLSMSEVAKSKVKTVQNYEGLDDPDTAAKWIRDNIKFYIKNKCYIISKIKGVEKPTDEVVKEEVKKTDDLNVAQKCWVIQLLKNLSECWMFGMCDLSKTYQGINEYFRPIRAGQFGTTGLDAELISYMEA